MMKKILKGLVKYVTLTVLLVCFLPLSLHHVKADEVEYSLPSYVGHLSIHDDGNATFTQEVTYDFDSDYKGQYVTLGKIGGYSIKVLNSKFIIQVQMVIGLSSKLLGRSNTY